MDISKLQVDGGRLAVEVRGQGPLVVCSPAMGDERDGFAPLADRLVAAGYRVALVDLRGHGDSDTGFPEYGDRATASDLLAVIESLGGPAVIAGASMSAGAAIIAAGTRPDLVSGLVLLGPFARNGNAAMAALLRVLLARPWGPTVWRGYSASLWPGLGAGARERAAHLSRRLARPDRWRAFARTAAGADHSVVAPFLPKVTARTLVVMGEADPDWKNPAAEAEWLAGELSAEVLLVPGVGHAPMLEAPDAVATRVLALLGEVTGAAGRS